MNLHRTHTMSIVNNISKSTLSTFNKRNKLLPQIHVIEKMNVKNICLKMGKQQVQKEDCVEIFLQPVATSICICPYTIVVIHLHEFNMISIEIIILLFFFFFQYNSKSYHLNVLCY